MLQLLAMKHMNAHFHAANRCFGQKSALFIPYGWLQIFFQNLHHVSIFIVDKFRIKCHCNTVHVPENNKQNHSSRWRYSKLFNFGTEG